MITGKHESEINEDSVDVTACAAFCNQSNRILPKIGDFRLLPDLQAGQIAPAACTTTPDRDRGKPVSLNNLFENHA